MMWTDPPPGAGTSEALRFHLPAGTVTFLMSDIEGSTRLWSAFPEAMRLVVADVYAIIDRAVTRYDGVRPVEQGEGDSVVGAFSRASDALSAAVQAQRELRAFSWSDGIDVRVRIALHTADAQLRDEGNYFGLALSRCARLRAIASGGQTVLSRATRDLVVDQLPDGVELLDCGTHRLRDLGRPEHVFALVHEDLPGDFGSLRSLDTFPNNLPDQLTSFVGRAEELRALRAGLSETRLLTLTGAGGAGKTRLALQLAADCLDLFSEGAWWVDLAAVGDPQLVSDAVAAALGVRPLPSMSALEACCARLATCNALVLLDNCEHLLHACGEVAETLLRSCPNVSVIATSRTSLGAAGETDWRVPSLSLPQRERERESVQALGQFDAVRLFIERARKARPNFAVTNENAPAVAQVCEELDGLPLAIELAAARVRMLSVEQIAAGLGDRFHLLTGGTRTALPRYQTLRASVDWSHELLSDPERALLRRLAVFAGGFTLDLAESVCADETLPRVAILDLLASLVDKSLVVAEERVGAVRYRMLETVRQYGVERLDEAGELGAMQDRQRDGLLALAEQIAPALHGPGQREWLDVLDHEAANLASALDRALETDGDLALRLCVVLTFWWKLRGLFQPAERGFARALEAANHAPSELRAQGLFGRGYLAAYALNIEVALRDLEQARGMAEAVGDQSTLARSLMMIGWLQLLTDPAGSRAMSASARDAARRCGDDWALITSIVNLAYTYGLRYEYDDAERLLDEVQPLTDEHGYLELSAWHWLGKTLRPYSAADFDQVRGFSDRALTASRAAGEPTTEALAQCFLGGLEVMRGDPRAAIARLEPARARMVSAGAGLGLGMIEPYLAHARAAAGEIEEARNALEQLVATGVDLGFLLSNATVNLAEILRVDGQAVASQARAEEALAIAERIGNVPTIAFAKEICGRLAAGREHWTDAETLLHDALALRVEYRILLNLPQTFDALAEVAAGLESYEEAARMLGAAQRARLDLGLERWHPDRARFAQLEESLRTALGQEGSETALSSGAELSLDQAVAWIRRARGERKRPARGWESLTPTEIRVVELVAEGLTNPQIGERMFISRGTVKVHLSHIFAKLGITTRAELAAEATRRAIVP
ncbi:MAG TPA: LuxR C-terminal-related transcriptional regulator [Solirubrobacteraceae bacterium]|nr:LuxR C-terminal-related transcriptional regulator [Solirubrobacteraceae bacterium]